MAQSVSGNTIDRVVAAGIAQWFHQASFQRKGRSFFRSQGDVIHTSNVQASKINMPDNARFAVNLGVEWPQWYKIWTGRQVGANPALAPTFVQTRLHPTAGAGRDYWWPANGRSDPDRIASEVVTALGIYAEAFWRRYSNLDAVLSEFEAGKMVPTGTPSKLVHAALLTRAGRAADARRAIAEAARRLPRGAAGFQHVSERLGLGDYAA